MSDLINPTKEQFAAFRALPDEGPIHMLNLIRLRARAGAEAYQAYARESGPVFERVGGRQHWIGRFDCIVIGPEDERWDIAFIAEYPNPGAFVEMLRDPDYREAVKHRTAAVEVSRLIRLKPQQSGKGFGSVL